MIKVFNSTDKTYSTNGNIVLKPTIANVHKEDNGDFYLDLETIFDEKEVKIQPEAGTIVSSQDASLTITDANTLKEAELTKIDGNTTQETTPTPTTPQPINVVSGRQDIVVAGKNLYKYGDYNVNTTYYFKEQLLLENFENNTTYTLSFDINVNETPFNVSVGYGNTNYASDMAEKYNLANGRNYITFTTNNTTYKNLYFRAPRYSTSGTQRTGIVSNIQIEKGNTATTYEAYKGTTYEINLGKNLFDINGDRTGGAYYTLTNGTIKIISATTSTFIYWNDKIDIKTSNYTFMLNLISTEARPLLKFYDSDGNVITNLSLSGWTYNSFYGGYWRDITTLGNNIFNLTLSNNVKKVQIGFVPKTLNGEFNNIYFGTTTTTYAPYKTPIELCKIGDYKDRIYKDEGTWYIEKKTNKIASYNGETITTDYISTTGELTTGATIYYVLDTPTYTEITDSELIEQLNAPRLLEGLNNISITSGDLAGEITIHYNYLDAASESIRYVDYLVPNNIVVANTPQGEQAFRITNVEKTKRKIKIKAYHVFYDTENYLIQDSYVVDKNCNDALDHLNNATDNTSPFTTISNVTTIDSYRCVRKSLYEAIQVVIERWGGHLVRDNWTIGVYDTIGQDNGVTIRYGKNLKDITASYNWDEVVTKLLPVGKDGLLLNAIDPTASVYVESTTQYDIPYTKTISFDQENISEEDYKDEQGNLNEEEYKQALVNDLAEKGQSYVQNNSIPKVNYTLSANVEKVSDVGDSVEVIDEKLGINIMTNIISYDYNCILNKYTQLEFGNFTPELKNLMNTITEETEKIIEEGTNTIKVTLTNELQEATSQIWNALGNSYVIYEGDKILIVDSLPKETATNVIMLNNGGIGFSNTGITGTFNSAWTIDNVLNMEQINVINLTADLIKGGTLKLGSNLNQNGQIEVYDESNSLIAELNKNGLKMYGVDGSYVLMNNSVGFSGYDRNDNPIYWVNGDEFHMKKSVVEEEITLCNKMRFIPITITDSNNNIVNDGIGLVSVLGGGN